MRLRSRGDAWRCCAPTTSKFARFAPARPAVHFRPRTEEHAGAGDHHWSRNWLFAHRLRDHHRDGVPVAGHGVALHPGGAVRRHPGDGRLSCLIACLRADQPGRRPAVLRGRSPPAAERVGRGIDVCIDRIHRRVSSSTSATQAGMANHRLQARPTAYPELGFGNSGPPPGVSSCALASAWNQIPRQGSPVPASSRSSVSRETNPGRVVGLHCRYRRVGLQDNTFAHRSHYRVRISAAGQPGTRRSNCSRRRPLPRSTSPLRPRTDLPAGRGPGRRWQGDDRDGSSTVFPVRPFRHAHWPALAAGRDRR